MNKKSEEMLKDVKTIANKYFRGIYTLSESGTKSFRNYTLSFGIVNAYDGIFTVTSNELEHVLWRGLHRFAKMKWLNTESEFEFIREENQHETGGYAEYL